MAHRASDNATSILPVNVRRHVRHSRQCPVARANRATHSTCANPASARHEHPSATSSGAESMHTTHSHSIFFCGGVFFFPRTQLATLLFFVLFFFTVEIKKHEKEKKKKKEKRKKKKK
jgi:hypothetical protein